MYKILLIFLASHCVLYGQNIQSYLSTATFWDDEISSSYIEIYTAFDANTLSLRKLNESFYADIEIKTEIIKNDSIVYSDHYILRSPGFKYATNNNLFFFDQKRIILANGDYTLKIDVSDREFKQKINQHVKEIKLDYNSNNHLELSDIQLVSSIDTSMKNHEMSKNGMLRTPFPSNYYSQNINDLSYYFELYNTHTLTDQRYLLNTYIETYETNIPLYDFNKFKRENLNLDKNFVVYFLNFNILEVPSGNYNLVCEIKNLENKSIVKKKIFFQRNSSFVAYKDQDINAVSVVGTFAESITDKDVLKLYIDYLYPISSPDENTFAQNQIRNNDLSLMQKFFYNFWKTRNPARPELAWDEYHRKVKSVNNDFKNFRTAGYLTDRGRVYLQYGSPNSRHKVENSSANYPYEIWHYYKLNNQINKKFVFVNSDLATNEYRLEYSNVYGEVSNAEWHNEIEQNPLPAFGDDFNNNYINPR